MVDRRAHLIFNPAAGRGDSEAELTRIREKLEASGIRVSLHPTEPDVPIARTVRAALQSMEGGAGEERGGGEFFIAAGGDGTVSGVAGSLLDTGIPLGVIPQGTANSFARALEIPANVDGALEIIAGGRTRRVDAGRGSRGPMVLMAEIGLGASMVADARRADKDRFGPLAYLWTGAQHMGEQESFRARLDAEELETELELNALTVANVAPTTSLFAQGCGEVIPDDGSFEVTLSSGDEVGLGEVASLLASAIRKSASSADNILCFRSANLQVSTDPPQTVVIDGEKRGTTPVDFTCAPRVLDVLVP